MRTGTSVRDLLRLVAIASLGLAATALPGTREAAVVVTGVGLGLWLIALVLDLTRRPDPCRDQGVGIVCGTITAFGLIEAAGLRNAWTEGTPDQAAWFAIALSFAASGVLGSLRRAARDLTFASQIAFHGVLALPAAALLANAALRQLAGRVARAAIDQATGLTRNLIVVTAVVLPALFLLLVVNLTLELTDRRDQESSAWPILLAAEAAVVILLARWGFDGL